MMRAWGCVALAATASAVMACSLLKKPGAAGDAGEDAAGSVAVTPEAATPGEAVNASEMTRYPDEKPIDHAPLTVAEQSANLRTQAGTGGDLVVVLKKGTEVQKLAEHEGFYLVLADDPKESSRKLMGWVAESAFEAAPSRRAEPEVRGDGGAPHVVADAGTKPAPGPAKPLDVHKTPNGGCPPGYAACAAVCRLTCKSEGDCGVATAHCTGGFCLGPGAAPCK